MLTVAASDVELSRLYRDMTRELRIPATRSVKKSFKTRWHAFWQGCKKLVKQVICKLFTDWEVRLEAVFKLDQYWSAKNTVSCFLQNVFLKKIGHAWNIYIRHLNSPYLVPSRPSSGDQFWKEI